MSWTEQLGLWLARQGGWQEKLPAPCPTCPPLKKEHAALQETAQKQAMLLAQKEAELSARPHIVLEPPPCQACAVTQQEKATLIVESNVQQGTIQQLEQKITHLNELLASKLETTKVSPEVMVRAKELVEAPRPDGMGGEAKRHATYAQLIKEFPETQKRDFGLAIEMALRSIQS